TPLVRDRFDIGFGRQRYYDPLWSYYNVAHRDDPRWSRNVADLYVGRYQGDIPRPPRTLVQQNQMIRQFTNVNVANVTNNLTVVNNNLTVNNRDVSPHVMVAPLRVAPKLQPQLQ